MNNFIFLGAPGAGKGSLAVKVAEEYKIPHISTGDIFRANIKAQTPLGVKVKAIIDSGSLVSDDLTFELVKDRLAQDDCKNGFILDGFPRTIPQAEMLDTLGLELSCVNFEIAEEIVIKRLSTRRVCKACGANYNVLTLPPKVEGVCDKCGGEIYQRDDDKQESILHRMEVYKEQTQPLIDYYNKKGNMTNLDASIETPILLEEFKKIFQFLIVTENSNFNSDFDCILLILLYFWFFGLFYADLNSVEAHFEIKKTKSSFIIIFFLSVFFLHSQKT